VGMGRFKLYHGTCTDVTKIAQTCISVVVELEEEGVSGMVDVRSDVRVSGVTFEYVEELDACMGLRRRQWVRFVNTGIGLVLTGGQFEYGVVGRDFFGERAGEYLRHANKCVMNRAHNLAVY
jgi:hypothetical protein